MLTEVDLGVNIDLIDPDTYALDPNGRFPSHSIQILHSVQILQICGPQGNCWPTALF